MFCIFSQSGILQNLVGNLKEPQFPSYSSQNAATSGCPPLVNRTTSDTSSRLSSFVEERHCPLSHILQHFVSFALRFFHAPLFSGKILRPAVFFGKIN